MFLASLYPSYKILGHEFIKKVLFGGQPKCPTNEWISKMWYVHAMEYHSAIKRNEILTHASTGMSLENIVLSEISQSGKDTYYMISLV